MKPCEVDREVKDLIKTHHVYGAEVLINALIRAAKDEYYLNEDDIIRLVVRAFRREREEA